MDINTKNININNNINIKPIEQIEQIEQIEHIDKENIRLMELETKYHLHKLIGFYYLESGSIPIFLKITSCTFNKKNQNSLELDLPINYLQEKDINFIKNILSNYLTSKEVSLNYDKTFSSIKYNPKNYAIKIKFDLIKNTDIKKNIYDKKIIQYEKINNIEKKNKYILKKNILNGGVYKCLEIPDAVRDITGVIPYYSEPVIRILESIIENLGERANYDKS